MKIAILTQPLHINYGGNLQAFALQMVLKKSGHEVETINYPWPKKNELWVTLSFIKNYIYSRKCTFSYTSKEMYKISKEHRNFIDKNIKLSPEIVNTQQLKNYFSKNDFDAVIVGSDQVWRKEYSPCIENFFLDFVKDHSNLIKISYAASFGVSEWNYSQLLTKKIYTLIRLFDHISVREDTAVALLKNNLDINSTQVLDPTLLLTEKDYAQFLKKKSEESYIFSYILDSTESKKKFLDIVKNNLGTDILNILPAKSKKDKLFLRSEDYSSYMYKSIEEWLTGIKYADYVVTDSFHGMVFSILFKKQFIVLANKERGVSRFTSLLGKLDLMDRLIQDFDSIDIVNIFKKSIDYSSVDKKLSMEREKSFDFLMQSISVK